MSFPSEHSQTSHSWTCSGFLLPESACEDSVTWSVVSCVQVQQVGTVPNTTQWLFVNPSLMMWFNTFRCLRGVRFNMIWCLRGMWFDMFCCLQPLTFNFELSHAQKWWRCQAVIFLSIYFTFLASVFSASCPEDGYFIKWDILGSDPLLQFESGFEFVQGF